MIYIREALPEDNQELQKLQAKCPQGTTLIVSVVNTPDFFARTKAYASNKVIVACEEKRIIGSHAWAMRDAIVAGELHRIGYSFQTFISPDHRKEGLAKRLLQQMEDHLIQNEATLVYGLIMEGNLPSMKLVGSLGFKLHRTLVMPGLAIYKEMDLSSRGKIRPMGQEDLTDVAQLLNKTWQGYDLYEPTSAEGLSGFINRTPAYRFDNLWVLEDQGEIQACLGFWDWRQIMKITVMERSLKIRMIGLLLDLIRSFRPMPRSIKGGDTLKQMMLTPMAFKDTGHLAVLLRYMNNHALASGIEQIFSVCERDHPLLNTMKGFIRIDTAIHLYIKAFQPKGWMGDTPVFIDGIDL
jgi:N-acetylglutamate synthase-like GNAT family acetyltransferase